MLIVFCSGSNPLWYVSNMFLIVDLVVIPNVLAAVWNELRIWFMSQVAIYRKPIHINYYIILGNRV